MSAVLLEQSAVWAYPITENCRAEDISDERIYMNMINSFLGRMYLAGHLERLNDRQLSLVKEGVDYYKSLMPAKKKGLPKFPIGFNKFSNDWVVAGFETAKNCISPCGIRAINCIEKFRLKDIKTPFAHIRKPTLYLLSTKKDTLTIDFTQEYQARFFELSKKKL